jgi:cell division septum initiation protein DivIVA
MTDEVHILSSKNMKLTREKSALEEKYAELHRLVEEFGQMESDMKRQKKYYNELEGLLKGGLKDLAGINQDSKAQTEKFLAESKKLAGQIIAKAEKQSERILSKANEDVRNLEQKILHLEFGRNKNVISQAEYYRAQFRLLEHEAEALGIELRPIEVPSGEKITPLAPTKVRKKA